MFFSRCNFRLGWFGMSFYCHIQRHLFHSPFMQSHEIVCIHLKRSCVKCSSQKQKKKATANTLSPDDSTVTNQTEKTTMALHKFMHLFIYR